MISDIFSYQISDFIMYSKEALGGLLSNYNDDIWPIQVFWVLISILIFYILVFKTRLFKLVFVFFSAAWFYTGWFFYKENFSSINLASNYAFYICALQGFLFLSLVFFKAVKFSKNFISLSIIFLCMFVPVEWLFKGDISEVTLFGWGPIPVSVASMALVSLIKGKVKLMLIAIPILTMIFALASHLYAQ